MANNQVLRKIGSPLRVVLANAGDFDNLPFDDTDQMNMTSLADGAARQSDQFDFGELTDVGEWSEVYDVSCSFEVDVAPVSGEIIEVYLAPSVNSDAALDNPGGVSGSDSAYTGTAGDSLVDSLKQLDFIGAVVCTSDADPVMQTQAFAYSPHARYGTLVVVNNSGEAFVGDAIHHYVIFTPIVPEIQ